MALNDDAALAPDADGVVVRARSSGRPRSPAVSREAIADAVVDLICAHGLHGWSMRDLAARLGLSTGTITYHFRDKQALLVEAMDSVYVLPANWDRYRTLPPAAQLRRMTEIYVLERERSRRWWRFWVEYMAGAGHDDTLRERHDERFERQRRFFARLIDAGIAAGEFTTALGAEREAERLLALGNGLALQQLVTPEQLTPDAARAILDDYLSGLQRGVDRPPAAV